VASLPSAISGNKLLRCCRIGRLHEPARVSRTGFRQEIEIIENFGQLGRSSISGSLKRVSSTSIGGRIGSGSGMVKSGGGGRGSRSTVSPGSGGGFQRFLGEFASAAAGQPEEDEQQSCKDKPDARRRPRIESWKATADALAGHTAPPCRLQWTRRSGWNSPATCGRGYAREAQPHCFRPRF
jgi:hypothetical protein